MACPTLEVADVFRRYGDAYRDAAGQPLTSAQRRVMNAIAQCRTAALGGHVEQCEACAHQRIAYNSCRNRHCPKCQSLARAAWVEQRTAELLDCEYFHVVFTVPAPIAALALQNKVVVYNILFRATADTLQTIAADPRHLGGLAPDGTRWIACRPGFFLPVRVLSRFFRRRFLEQLETAVATGQLQLSGSLERLHDPHAWRAYLAPLRQQDWVVYAKRPFAGPQQVLDYVGRYTHRVAISNDRLSHIDDDRVTFTYKDYRTQAASKTMTLAATEFIRRFLLHVLPLGFHRIRYYGVLSPRHRTETLARCRRLLAATLVAAITSITGTTAAPSGHRHVGEAARQCPACGHGRLIVIERLAPRTRPSLVPDTS